MVVARILQPAIDTAVRVQPALGRTAAASQQAANAVSTLLLNASASIALVFGLWRLGHDLGWTSEFVIPSGLFSHWQVWLALALALRIMASAAAREAAKNAEPRA